MKHWKLASVVVACTAMVAGCGGGGGGVTPSFTQLVSFGDSLSDVGNANVGTIKAVGGGKWTVNSATSKNWTEIISAQYGLPAPCAAQTGLPSVLFPGFTGAAVQNFSACRNYAQGSSRVTSTYGPNSLALQQALIATAGATVAAQQAGLGLTAIPIVTQMANHLAAAGGTYSGKELVTVMAGGNDVFLNLSGVSSASAGGAGAIGAATFAAWTLTPTQQGTLAGGGAAAVALAQQLAVAGMAQAGTELATAVKTQVIAKGAKYVAVLTLPDVSLTPYGNDLEAASPGTGALIRTLVTTFNTALQAGVAGTGGVLVIDAYTQNSEQIKNPVQYGISDVKTRACSKTSAANPLAGLSLACTAASTIAGDTSKFAFADDVHPTPYAYQLLAQFAALKIALAGWP